MKYRFIIPLILLALLAAGCTHQIIESVSGVATQAPLKIQTVLTPPYLRIQHGSQTADISESGWFTHTAAEGIEQTYRQTTRLNPFSVLTVDTMDSSEFTMTFTRQPDQLIENIYSEGKLVQSFPLEKVEIILPQTDGYYEIEWVATYLGNNSPDYRGEMHYRLSLELDLPASLSILNPSVEPGDLIILEASHVNEGQALYVTSSFYEGVVDFSPVGNRLLAFFPVDAAVLPGSYDIRMSTIEPSSQSESTSIQSVAINPKVFEVQHLIVSEETLALRSAENEANDQILIDAARANPVGTKLWEGAFIKSAEGYLTTDFAQIRYTNDNPTPRYHSGIDLANEVGTPILAANTGTVVMSEVLYITGGTIIIDHGLGLYSYYYHLNELLAAEGTLVKKGDLIAKMGTTGFSTGSHLHFSISKNNIVLNPWPFFEKDPIDFR